MLWPRKRHPALPASGPYPKRSHEVTGSPAFAGDDRLEKRAFKQTCIVDLSVCPDGAVVAIARSPIQYHAAPGKVLAPNRRCVMLDKPADTPTRATELRPARDFQAHVADLEARGFLVRIDR